MFPALEQYLEEDMIADSFLNKIISQYFETTELPQFDLISIAGSSQDKKEQND